MADDFSSYREALDSPADNAAAVTPGSSALTKATRAVYVGGAGNMNVTMVGGGDVLFSGIAAGQVLPIRVSHILSSSTTATNIVALW
jgi:hypothetical protein